MGRERREEDKERKKKGKFMTVFLLLDSGSYGNFRATKHVSFISVESWLLLC